MERCLSLCDLCVCVCPKRTQRHTKAAFIGSGIAQHPQAVKDSHSSGAAVFMGLSLIVCKKMQEALATVLVMMVLPSSMEFPLQLVIVGFDLHM